MEIEAGIQVYFSGRRHIGSSDFEEQANTLYCWDGVFFANNHDIGEQIKFILVFKATRHTIELWTIYKREERLNGK